jgi:hypothetical protein
MSELLLERYETLPEEAFVQQATAAHFGSIALMEYGPSWPEGGGNKDEDDPEEDDSGSEESPEDDDGGPGPAPPIVAR